MLEEVAVDTGSYQAETVAVDIQYSANWRWSMLQ
jgi:hypothetical protein